MPGMDEFESTIVAILNKERGTFSAMARRGFRKQGRGAVFIWESEGKGAFTTFRASFLPLSNHAFHQSSSPEPKQMAERYDPHAELVAVFVSADETVHTVRIELSPEQPQPLEV